MAGTLLEEGLDGALQVLGGKELARLGADRLVGRRDTALAVTAKDVLRHRMGPGRAYGQLGGEGASPFVEALVVEDAVDDAPALELLGAEEIAGHHQLAGAAAPRPLGKALRA